MECLEKKAEETARARLGKHQRAAIAEQVRKPRPVILNHMRIRWARRRIEDQLRSRSGPHQSFDKAWGKLRK